MCPTTLLLLSCIRMRNIANYITKAITLPQLHCTWDNSILTREEKYGIRDVSLRQIIQLVPLSTHPWLLCNPHTPPIPSWCSIQSPPCYDQPGTAREGNTRPASAVSLFGRRTYRYRRGFHRRRASAARSSRARDICATVHDKEGRRPPCPWEQLVQEYHASLQPNESKGLVEVVWGKCLGCSSHVKDHAAFRLSDCTSRKSSSAVHALAPPRTQGVTSRVSSTKAHALRHLPKKYYLFLRTTKHQDQMSGN